MAAIVLRERRKHHKMRYISENEDQMVVKSLSVPLGLEALMEGLTKEVLRIQPQDICLFASEHFAKLCKLRDATGAEYQYCKTTIHDKNKKNNIPIIRSDSQTPHPKDEVELLDAKQPVSVPRLDLGRLSAPSISPEIKFNRSEASTAEIDKLQNGFFHSAANFINVAQVAGRVFVNTPKLVDDADIDVEENKDVNGDEKLLLDETDKELIAEEYTELISEDNETNLVEESIEDTNAEDKILVEVIDKPLEKDIEKNLIENINEEINLEAKILIDETEKQLDLVSEDTEGNFIEKIQESEEKDFLNESDIQPEIEANLISEDIKETELNLVEETNIGDEILEDEAVSFQQEETNIEETKASPHPEERETDKITDEVQNEVLELALEASELEEIAANLFDIPDQADIKLSTEDTSELTTETIIQVPEDLEETQIDTSENIDIENKIDETKIELSQEESKLDNLDLADEIKNEIEELDIHVNKEIENATEMAELISAEVDENTETNLDKNYVLTEAEKKIAEDEDSVVETEGDITVTKVDVAADEQVEEIDEQENLAEESETNKDDDIKLEYEDIKEKAEEMNEILANIKEIQEQEINLEGTEKVLEESIDAQKETNEIEKEKNELLSDILKSDAAKIEEIVVENALKVESLIENMDETSEKQSELIENIQETDNAIETLLQAELNDDSKTENVLNSDVTQIAVEEFGESNGETQENENHGRNKRSISMDDIDELTNLQIPEISTINATPTPSEEEQEPIDHSITEQTLLKLPADQDDDETTLNKSALLIQSIWRGYNIRKLKKSLTALETAEQINNNEVTGKENIAATLIQSLWRGHISRKQNLAQSTGVAVENEIQCVNMEDIIAATKLQAIWRGYLARKHQHLKQNADTLPESEELHEVTIEEIMAARKLQSVWRGYATRKAFKSNVSKIEATLLQNEDKLHEVSTIEEILAATKLQSIWRGFATRKTMKSDVSKIEEIELKNIEKLNEEIAATKLQSTWRGFATRKALNTNESKSEIIATNETKIDDIAMKMNAAIKIQSIWRGFKTRKLQKLEVENNEKQAVSNEADESMTQIIAATLIQSLWRGHLIRKDKNIDKALENIDNEGMKQVVAATLIQSLWRGHTIRKNKNLDEIDNENLPITEEILKETVNILESEPLEHSSKLEEYLNDVEKTDLNAVLTADIVEMQEMEPSVIGEAVQTEGVLDIHEDKLDENEPQIEVNSSADSEVHEEIKEAINILEEEITTVETKPENEDPQILDIVDEFTNDENISKTEADDPVGIAVEEAKEDLIEIEDKIILDEEIKATVDITEEENEETSVLDAVNETTKAETEDSEGIAVEEAKVDLIEITDKIILDEKIKEAVDITEAENEELVKIADTLITDEEIKEDVIKDLVNDTTIDENNSKTETEASISLKIEKSEEELKEIADTIITEIEIADSLTDTTKQDNKEELKTGETLTNTLDATDDDKTNDKDSTLLDEATEFEELVVDDKNKFESSNAENNTGQFEDTEENISADITEEAEKQDLIIEAEMKIQTDLENQIISEQSADETKTEEQSNDTNADIKETLEEDITNVLEKELETKLDEVQKSETVETTTNEENEYIEEQVENIIKQTKAATKLQSVWRGYNYRKSNKVDDTEETQVDISEDNEKVSANITENLEILESELENTDNSELTSEQQQLEDVSVKNIIETPNQILNLTIEENQIPIIEDYHMDPTEDNRIQSSEIQNEFSKTEDGINVESIEEQDPSKIEEIKTEEIADIDNSIVNESSIEEIINNESTTAENKKNESLIIEEKNEDESRLHEALPEEIISVEVKTITENIEMENEILEETTPEIQEPIKLEDEIIESNEIIGETQTIEEAAESSIIDEDTKVTTDVTAIKVIEINTSELQENSEEEIFDIGNAIKLDQIKNEDKSLKEIISESINDSSTIADENINNIENSNTIEEPEEAKTESMSAITEIDIQNISDFSTDSELKIESTPNILEEKESTEIVTENYGIGSIVSIDDEEVTGQEVNLSFTDSETTEAKDISKTNMNDDQLEETEKHYEMPEAYIHEMDITNTEFKDAKDPFEESEASTIDIKDIDDVTQSTDSIDQHEDLKILDEPLNHVSEMKQIHLPLRRRSSNLELFLHEQTDNLNESSIKINEKLKDLDTELDSLVEDKVTFFIGPNKDAIIAVSTESDEMLGSKDETEEHMDNDTKNTELLISSENIEESIIPENKTEDNSIELAKEVVNQINKNLSENIEETVEVEITEDSAAKDANVEESTTEVEILALAEGTTGEENILQTPELSIEIDSNITDTKTAENIAVNQTELILDMLPQNTQDIVAGTDSHLFANKDEDIDNSIILQVKSSLDEATPEIISNSEENISNILDITSETPNLTITVNNDDSSVIEQVDSIVDDFGNESNLADEVTNIRDSTGNLITIDTFEEPDDNNKAAEENTLDHIPKEENANTIVDNVDKELEEVEALNLRLKNLSRANAIEILQDEISTPEVEKTDKAFEDSKKICDIVDNFKSQEELSKGEDDVAQTDKDTSGVHEELDITIVPGVEKPEDIEISELGKNIESFDKALMEITEPIILRSHMDENIIDRDDEIKDIDLKTHDSPNIENETVKQSEIEESNNFTEEPIIAIEQNEAPSQLETKPPQIAEESIVEVEQENDEINKEVETLNNDIVTVQNNDVELSESTENNAEHSTKIDEEHLLDGVETEIAIELTDAEGIYEEVNKELTTNKDTENESETLVESKPEEQELLIPNVHDDTDKEDTHATSSTLIDKTDLEEPKLSVNIDVIQENGDNLTENISEESSTTNYAEEATKHDAFQQENKSENVLEVLDNEEIELLPAVALNEIEEVQNEEPKSELLEHTSENIVTEIIHDNSEEIIENMNDKTPLESMELHDATTDSCNVPDEENINENEILKNEDKDNKEHAKAETVIEESITPEEITPENNKVENIEENNSNENIIDGNENGELNSEATTENVDSAKNNQAAVKIHSAWRGHNTRRTIQDQKELTDLQKPTECDELPEHNTLINDADIISKAATTIQAGARGYLVRKRRNAPKFIETPQENSNSLNIDEPADNISLASMVTVIEKPVTVKSPEIPIETHEIEEQSTGESENKETNNENLELSTEETEISKKEDNFIGSVSEQIADINTIDKTLEEENTAQDIEANDQEITNIKKKETVEHLDEIDALNLRLQNLSRSNVYHSESPNEENKTSNLNSRNSTPIQNVESLDLNIVETTKNNDDKNDLNKDIMNEHVNVLIQPEIDEEIAQIMENPVVSNEPRRSVNFDEIDIDSSKYDLKVNQHTPRSKNSSPVHELSSAALKIGAAITVQNDTIVDAIDGREEVEEKPVDYIHIPLQGPIPEVTQRKLEKADTKKTDSDSPEYIYIPLKDPNAKETIEVEHNNQEIIEDIPEIKSEANVEETNTAHVKEDTIINDGPSKIEEIAIQESSNDKTLDNANATLNDDTKESREEIHLSTTQLNIGNLKDESLKSEVPEENTDANENTAVKNVKEEDINETTTTVSPIEASLNEDSNSEELQKSDTISLNEGTYVDESKEETLIETVPEELNENAKLDPISLNERTAVVEGQKEDIKEADPEKTVENIKLYQMPLNEETAVVESKKEDMKETVPEKSTENVKSDSISLNEETVGDELTQDIIEDTVPEEPAENNKSDQISLNEALTVEESKEEDAKETVLEETTKNTNSETESLGHKTPEIASEEFSNEDAAEEVSKKETTPHQEAIENADSLINITTETQPEDSKDYSEERLIGSAKSQSPRIKSPIADIDEFLKRNKQRTITRQDNVESSGHRKLFDEIDSIIESYGQKRQMSPTSSSTGDYTELESPKIENESSVQGHQLSDEQTSVPNVIMAHNSDAAATKIQSAYRGFQTRQQLKANKDASSGIGLDTQDTQMERKNSLGSDKTYTVVRSPTNISTPEDVSSDEETVKNLAASKIQKSYRNYRNKQSIDEEDLKNEAASKIQESYKNYRQKRSLSLIPTKNENFPNIHQVHQFKISDLESKYLDYPNEIDTSPTTQEELKDISEISNCAATKIQSTYRGFKTRQTLQNNNTNESDLETIPEVVSPNAADNSTENMGGEDVISETSLKDEYSQLRRPTNEEVSSGLRKKINGIETKINNDESVPHYSVNNEEYDSDADGAYKHHPHSDDATDEEIAKDSTTTTTTTRTTTSGIRSESSIYDEDESEPSDAKSSPDAHHQLAQGYDADEDIRNEHGNGEHYRTAGLQHSGEMHDSVDIFLSSEELSQGAEVLTSRDITKTDDRDDDGADGRSTVTEAGDARAPRESAAKYANALAVSNDGDHVHSVMETAKNEHNKKNCISNNATSTPASQPPQGEMGGNDEANAATKIQAGFRGYQVRKQMKTKKNGSDDAKQVKRCSSGRRRSSGRRGETPKSGNDLEEKSATKIQAGIRGFLVRKRQQNAKGSKA